MHIQEECFGPQLGYSVPPNLIALANVSPDIVDAILRVLLIILILVLIGAIPNWGYSRSWGYGPSGFIGVVLVIVLILLLMGRL